MLGGENQSYRAEAFAGATAAASPTAFLRESVNAVLGSGTVAAKVGNAAPILEGEVATLGEKAGRGSGRIAPSAADYREIAPHRIGK